MSTLILRELTRATVFRFMHYSLITLQLREHIYRGRSPTYTLPRSMLQWQPFHLWLSNLLLIHAGDMLGNVLLGITPLEALRCPQDMLLSTVVWYLIFYSPFDIGFGIARLSGYRILAISVAAISQVLHIEATIKLAAKTYNNEWLPMLIIGTAVGSSAEFLKPVVACILNRCQSNRSTYAKLTLNTKIAMLISLLHWLDNTNQKFFGAAHEHLQLYIILALLIFKYFSLVYRVEHLIWLIETKICYTIYGGWLSDIVKLCKPDEKTCADDSYAEHD